MTLNLIDPIWYRPSAKSLDELIASLPEKDRGYDAFVLYSLFLTDDSMELNPILSGERDGYSEEDKKRIESGLSPERKDDESLSIPTGSYLFEQFPAIFASEDLPRLILPYASKPGRIYIRLFKESILESVLQLLIER